jgi:predicted nucleic acid-binding protein
MYTFDACALIAAIDKEEGWAKVESILRNAYDGKTQVYMSVINLLEVFYHCAHKFCDYDRAREVIRSIKESPIEVLYTIDEEVFCEAARLKSLYKISLADAVACATTWWTNSTLVTCDHSELEAVEEREHLPMLWIRPKPETP